MADHAHITRRGVLSTIASSAFLSAPTAALAETADSPSPIAALYAGWLELYNVPAEDLADDDATNALVDRMRVIEDEMCAIPARDGCDFALKVCALTHYGNLMFEERHDGQVFADARRLIAEAGL